MREISLGPVSNPDGSPSDLTISLLGGTGRDPVEFARQTSILQHIRAIHRDDPVEAAVMYVQTSTAPDPSDPTKMPWSVDAALTAYQRVVGSLTLGQLHIAKAIVTGQEGRYLPGVVIGDVDLAERGLLDEPEPEFVTEVEL